MRPKTRVGTMLTASGPCRRALKITPTAPVEKATGNPRNMRRTMEPNSVMLIHSMLTGVPFL